MNELGTALRELAREAAAPTSGDPARVWAAGRSRVRRRRVGAAVVVIVLGLIGYAGVSRPMPQIVMPAGPVHAPAIPENIYGPNRFLAGVSKTGAPGRLAVIASTTQNDANRYYGRWFGITATTGRYVALDLPGRATDSRMWLSPDGDRIAYVITGPTKKKSYGKTTPDLEGGPLPLAPPVGIGVYDTRDGSVIHYRTLTDMGWGALDETSLSWTDDTTLIFAYDVAVAENSATAGGSWLWHPGSDQPRRISDTDSGDASDARQYIAGFPASVVVRSTGDGPPYAVVDSDGKPTGRTISYPVDGRGGNTLSVSGNRVLLVGFTAGSTRSKIELGEQAEGSSTVSFTPITTLTFPGFLGWRSSSTVLVDGQEGEVINGELEPKDLEQGRLCLYSLDVDTKHLTRLGTVHDSIDQETLQAADSLLSEPLVHGRKPPNAIEAFCYPLLVVGLALAGIAAFLEVRRRRRRA
ncbi:MAG TPA: hypothetical protein VFE15_05080 [Marmoricola sp.]|jgi:hypothetical protein|nr:hypothetical protein [Marmoricola sp.]